MRAVLSTPKDRKEIELVGYDEQSIRDQFECSSHASFEYDDEGGSVIVDDWLGRIPKFQLTLI